MKNNGRTKVVSLLLCLAMILSLVPAASLTAYAESSGSESVTPVTFNYTGAVQTYTAPVDGYYKLEAWGAQGGTTSKGKAGGKGGFSTGIIYLTQGTTLSVYVGGRGGASTGGWNGGGTGVVGKKRDYQNQEGRSGGGATDFRISGDTLYHRVLVAGGGGGAVQFAIGYKNGYYSYAGADGGAGGGTDGSQGTIGSVGKAGGYGGTQTDGGAGGYGKAATGNAGTFGNGGNTNGSSSNAPGGGGGGGWYGGGAGGRGNAASSAGKATSGGGGSGFAFTGGTPIEGYKVDEQYALTSTSMSNNSRAGDGQARITPLTTVFYVKQNADGTWPADASGSEKGPGSAEGAAFNLSRSYEHYTISGWSTEYKVSESDRTAAHQGESIKLDADALYVYYALDTYNLAFYADREGRTVWKTLQVYYGGQLSSLEPTVTDTGTWNGDNQLSGQNSELFTFGGWATEPGITVWSSNGTSATDKAFDWNQTMPAEDVSLYPVWVANYIHVILDAGAWDQYNTYTQDKYDPATPVTMDQSQGRSFWKSTDITEASSEYDKYVNMDKMNAATRTGYTLNGWYTSNGMKWASNYLIAREYGDKDANGNLILTYDAPYRNYTYVLTLTAKWKPNNAQVTYDVGSGTGSFTDDNTYIIDDSFTIPAASPTPPTAEESGMQYVFKGWKDRQGNLHQPGESIVYTDDLVSTFGATNKIKFTAEYQLIPQGSLVFDSQGGSLILPLQITENTNVDLSGYIPTRTGYYFNGWYAERDCTTALNNSITMTQSDMTIYAKWIAKQYTFTFDSKGGTAVETITKDYGSEVTPPTNPTRTGYTFKGWDKTVPAKMPAGDMTFDAQWEVNSHKVIYKYQYNNGNEEKEETRNFHEFVVEPAVPTWEGHTFIRWNDANGDAVTFPIIMPDSDVTLSAVWKENQQAPNVPDATPSVNTIILTNPSADEEYILVSNGRMPTDADWTNAKKIDSGTGISFDGLAPHTTYDLYARKSGTDAKMPSPASQKNEITTLKADQTPPAAPIVEALPPNVIVDFALDGAEYIIVSQGGAIPENPEWRTPGVDGKVVFENCDPNTAYDVYARMKETERQYPSATSPAATVTTPKYPPVEISPVEALEVIYNGQAQKLVTAGEVTGGTMQYALGENDETVPSSGWDTSIPIATEVGTYYIWYKVVGDENHTDTAAASVTVTIAKANPTYTVPTGLTATYGDTLSSVALPTGWAWADGTQSVGSAGTNSFKANFTPADTANYNAVSDVDVSVAVGKANPTYTAPTGLTATYGQTLANVTLPTGWAWVDGTQSVGNAGTNTFKANFTPADINNYNTVSGIDVKVTVGKAAGKTAVISTDTMTYNYSSIYIEGVAGQEYIIVPKGTAVTDADWNTSVKPDPERENWVFFENLNAATEYEIYTRTAETETAFASDAVKATVYTTLSSIGYLYDSTLVGASITVEPDPDVEGLTYKWYQDEVTEDDEGAIHHNLTEISGATGSTYTFREEDVGKHIAVKIFSGDSEVGDFATDTPVALAAKVIFDSKGGSDVETLTDATYQSKIKAPADPTREGFAFDGWYWDEEYETPFDFEKDVITWNETTLYAKWTPNDYNITSVTGLSGSNNKQWTKGGKDGVVITVKVSGEDNSFDHFTGVKLDGVELVKDVDYTVEKGSTIVTLKPETLEKLSVGEHTVTVLFNNGEVNTTLTVLAANSGDATSPKTGDNSHLGLWIALMMLSLLGIAASLIYGKKKRVFDR